MTRIVDSSLFPEALTFDDVLLTPGLGQNPRPVGQRRLMPDMLSMAAGQVGHPIPILIDVKAYDRLLHRQTVPLQRLKGPFRPLLRRGKCPTARVLAIKGAEISQTRLDRSKFDEFDDAAARVEPADIELPDYVQTPAQAPVHITPADASGVRKEVAADRAPMSFHGKREIEPSEKRMGGDSCDREFGCRRDDCHGRHGEVAVTADNQPRTGRKDTDRATGGHLAVGIFGAPPIASRPACAQASSRCAPGAPPTPIPPTTSPRSSIGNPPPRIRTSEFMSLRACNVGTFPIISANSVVGRRKLDAVYAFFRLLSTV